MTWSRDFLTLYCSIERLLLSGITQIYPYRVLLYSALAALPASAALPPLLYPLYHMLVSYSATVSYLAGFLHPGCSVFAALSLIERFLAGWRVCGLVFLFSLLPVVVLCLFRYLFVILPVLLKV